MTPTSLRVVRITAASALTGLVIGVVGSAFRYLLLRADGFRNALALAAHGWPHMGWMAPVLLSAAGAGLARMLVVHFQPYAAGSGIQQVEAVFSGEAKQAGIGIVPVKFVGGLLAMGSGLALGLEGPTVQMGSSLAFWGSKWLLRDEADRKVVGAAGAGAGLGVAFNAPVGGAVFVFEELTSSFTPWLLVATLAAASAAVWAMRLLLGNNIHFTVNHITSNETQMLTPYLALGAMLGAVGALYNRVSVALLRFSDRLVRITSVYWATLVGAGVGLVVWFAPNLAGGGDPLTQGILSNKYGIGALLVGFVLRFLIGPWSYAAGTPGGLFAPMLVLGASFGALFGGVANHFIPGIDLSPVACAVVGMAALFSASVRAPLTGIVLAVEMTGRGDLTLGLLAGSMGAMVVAMLLKSEPIYVTLKERMLKRT
jgi:chloride channel protein, CIC family